MSDNDVKIGRCEAWMSDDGQHLSIFTGDYEYGCFMKISEWEAVKTAIDKMIAEVSHEKPNPTAACREISAIHG